MRELKFRAWDKERNEMFPVNLMDWSQWWVSCDPNHGQAQPLDYGERNSFKNESTDRHILMQYTGLKDRNGVEIYDGDILKDDLLNEYLGEVKWIADWAMFGVNHDKIESLLRWASVSEVIGNIHEHPHLLVNKS